MKANQRFAGLLCLSAFITAGCAHQMESKAPAPGLAEPRIVCNEQVTKSIVLTGEGFSPTLFDALTDKERLVLPALSLTREKTLDGTAAMGTPIVIPDDPAAPALSRVRWTSQRQMIFDVFPQLALEPGVYAITVRNASGLEATASNAMTVVPRPTVTQVAPDLACTEQSTTALVVTGTSFLKLGDTLPRVKVGDKTYVPTEGTGCATIAGPVTTAQLCTGLRIVLAMGDFAPVAASGLAPQAVIVENPAPAECRSTEDERFTALPRPRVARIDTDLACVEQYANDFVLTGTDFFVVAGRTPSVAIGAKTYTPTTSNCTTLMGSDPNGFNAADGTVQRCTTLTVTVPMGDQPDGLQPVSVTNPAPAGCRSSEPVDLLILPRPAVTTVEPTLVCREQLTNTVTVRGTGFLTIDGAVPEVTLGPTTFRTTSVRPTDCVPLTGRREALERCGTLVVTAPAESLSAGLNAVSVRNPTPAQCQSTDLVELLGVPRPTVTAVEPPLVCREQLANNVIVRGAGFLTIDGVVPEVTLGAATFRTTSVVASDCVPIAGRREVVQQCSTLSVSVPAGSLATGLNAVSVRNPAPAACQSTDAFNLVGVERPAITSVSRPALCLAEAEQSLELRGRGFLVVGTTAPTVTLTSGATTRTYAPTASNCAGVTGAASAQLCTTLTIRVPMSDLPVGVYTLTVRNPAPAACGSTDSITLRVTAPPTVNAVSVQGVATPRVCASGGSITVTGTGFQSGATVGISLPGDGEVLATTVTVAADGTSLTASFTGPLRASITRYDVNVRNPDGCGRGLSDVLQVTRGVFTFFADPPVVYNGVSTKITVLAAGLDPLGTGPTEVRLQRSGATAIVFTGAQIDWGGDDNPARPQRVRIVVAAGTPAGVYDVAMTDGTGCTSELAGGLTIVADTRLALTAATPPFGWRNEDTALTLTAKATANLGANEVNFRNLPRVYLSPSDNAAGTATEARAVTFADATRITAVAPNRSAGLSVGDYDVLVVNPTGEVGILRRAYKVTNLAPPIIDSVAPGTLRTNPSPAAATIAGRDFRTPAVRFTCRAAGSTTDVIPTVSVSSSTSTSIAASVDMSTLSSGMTCIVRVTNGDDGSFFDFAAVTTANPSQGANPVAFSAGPLLVTARRAPAGANARPTRTSRFVYAIGGDNGATSGALSSVEAAPVGLFGDLGTWFTLPIALTAGNPAASTPTPTVSARRTFAGAARVGRFLYLVGGHDGTSATNKVLRAQVLVPEEAPLMGDPDLVIDEDSDDPAGGLPAGLFSYRVSAMLTAAQAQSPGGETLAADALLVRLPNAQFPTRLYLCWQPPAQPAGVAVSKYRIYRTRTANEAPGAERLLAECPGSSGCSLTTTCYEDSVISAGDFLDQNRSPLPLGSTGVWHEVAPLPEAKLGAGVAATSINASSGAARMSLVVVGGAAAVGGGGIGSTHTLTVNVDEPQLPGATWVSGPSLPSPRSELGLFVASAINAPRATPNVWLYAGGGRGAESNVHAAQLNLITGALGTTPYPSWLGVDTFQGGGRIGYASAVSNDFLYVVAGLSGGAPTNNGDKAEMCGGTQTCNGGADDPPDLVNWNNTQTGALQPRYQPGQAIQSSYWFLFGGSTTGENTASRTCDVTVLGGQP